MTVTFEVTVTWVPTIYHVCFSALPLPLGGAGYYAGFAATVFNQVNHVNLRHLRAI